MYASQWTDERSCEFVMRSGWKTTTNCAQRIDFEIIVTVFKSIFLDKSFRQSTLKVSNEIEIIFNHHIIGADEI